MPPTPAPRPPSLSGFIDRIGQHLRSEREEGVRTVEVEASALAELAKPPPTAASGQRRPTAAAPVRPAPATVAATPRSSATVVPTGAVDTLEGIARQIAACTNCPLCRTRNRTVPGQGNPTPELMFVGEGPGADEDAQGLAFVGRAGQLLTRLIARMGFTREQVFIGNIVKCRPTENMEMIKDRAPTPEEMAACLPFLKRQMAVLRPKVIVALGGTATGALTGRTGISRLRGNWLEFEGIPLMPTFHPSYLLRGGGDEKARYWDVWSDMGMVLQRLGRPVPEVTRKG